MVTRTVRELLPRDGVLKPQPSQFLLCLMIHVASDGAGCTACCLCSQAGQVGAWHSDASPRPKAKHTHFVHHRGRACPADGMFQHGSPVLSIACAICPAPPACAISHTAALLPHALLACLNGRRWRYACLLLRSALLVSRSSHGAQDIAIAHGYNAVPRALPASPTLGGEQPLNQLTDLLRLECAMAGYTEILTWALHSRAENWGHMLLPEDSKAAVGVGNPATIEFEVCRTSLLPGARGCKPGTRLLVGGSDWQSKVASRSLEWPVIAFQATQCSGSLVALSCQASRAAPLRVHSDMGSPFRAAAAGGVKAPLICSSH